uniref:Exosome protein n=1 Tax=Candidatus Methanomethylicus mesodigestus TaxID=1867258 RepID=A0A7C3IS66_9CREN
MIRSFSASAISHSTEDPSKVRSALLNLFPPDLRGNLEVTFSEAKGHHGNEISLMSVDLPIKEAAAKTVEYILNSLPPPDRMQIRDRIGTLFDGKSSVYLRLDKQLAYRGALRIAEGDDTLKVRIGIFMLRGGIEATLKALSLA